MSENGTAMELVLIIGIGGPCALVALLILVTALRPTAAPALALVLGAVAEPIHAMRKPPVGPSKTANGDRASISRA
jgi:hypothetical protein